MAACGGCGGNGRDRPQLRYDYLVTPGNQVFRVLKAGPVTRGSGGAVGNVISYIAQTPAPSVLAQDAEQLVAALGPEMELTGDRSVAVEALLGYESRSAGPHLIETSRSFKAEGDRWVKSAETEGEADARSALLSPTRLEDDASFPYHSASLAGAAAAAIKWIGLLDTDTHEADAIARTGVDPSFRAQVEASKQGWRSLLQQRRNLDLPGERRELYRMQTRPRNFKKTDVETALIQYESKTDAGRVLERFMMATDASGAWLVSGYLFEPIPRAPSAK